ncbi:hypothetical protein [Carp edema virus]|nr:hypothetical protein [Carp edema virus]
MNSFRNIILLAISCYLKLSESTIIPWYSDKVVFGSFNTEEEFLILPENNTFRNNTVSGDGLFDLFIYDSDIETNEDIKINISNNRFSGVCRNTIFLQFSEHSNKLDFVSSGNSFIDFEIEFLFRKNNNSNSSFIFDSNLIKLSSPFVSVEVVELIGNVMNTISFTNNIAYRTKVTLKNNVIKKLLISNNMIEELICLNNTVESFVIFNNTKKDGTTTKIDPSCFKTTTLKPTTTTSISSTLGFTTTKIINITTTNITSLFSNTTIVTKPIVPNTISNVTIFLLVFVSILIILLGLAFAAIKLRSNPYSTLNTTDNVYNNL